MHWKKAASFKGPKVAKGNAPDPWHLSEMELKEPFLLSLRRASEQGLVQFLTCLGSAVGTQFPCGAAFTPQVQLIAGGAQQLRANTSLKNHTLGAPQGFFFLIKLEWDAPSSGLDST